MPPEQLHPPEPGMRLTPQLFVGFVVIVVGLLMTLDNLGLVRAENFIRFWPAALIGLGALKMWYSRQGLGGAFGGFIFIVVGSWLLLEKLAVVQLSFWDMWPTLLVFFGGFLVWQGLSGQGRRLSADTTGTVTGIAVLGAVVRGNNSPAFRGGELTAVLGGVELDLRQAAINGEAVLEVFGLWGGIEIRVPEDWTIESRVVAVLGGVEDKTRAPQSATRHRLVIRGLIVMAGIEIKH